MLPFRRLKIAASFALGAAAAVCVGLLSSCSAPTGRPAVTVAPAVHQPPASPPQAPHAIQTGKPEIAVKVPTLAQLPIIPAGRSPDIAVLMYHDVLPEKQIWFDTTLDDFQRQMQAIHDRGHQVISAVQLWRHLTQGAPVPPHPVVLTFDDANEGQFLYALPVLEHFRYHATFFIHTGYVGVTTSKAHMTWDQLRQAEATGFVDVEGRTVTHPCNMPDLSSAQLDRELSGGIAAVQTHLGHPSLFFSYPCGHYNAKAEAAVKRAGYLLAFDEDRGFANRSPSIFAVNRFAPKRFDEAVPPVTRR